MIRPMTSNVSALSGIVANGHQTLHFVSSSPSKIPTVVFPSTASNPLDATAIFAGESALAYSCP